MRRMISAAICLHSGRVRSSSMIRAWVTAGFHASVDNCGQPRVLLAEERKRPQDGRARAVSQGLTEHRRFRYAHSICAAPRIGHARPKAPTRTDSGDSAAGIRTHPLPQAPRVSPAGGRRGCGYLAVRDRMGAGARTASTAREATGGLTGEDGPDLRQGCCMIEPTRYPQAPIELPLDDWLYEARPIAGCATCEEASIALAAAKRAGEAWARFDAARTIRRHPHGRTTATS
jgi:hypothetical protein